MTNENKFSVGQPVKSKGDVKKFLSKMVKEYNITTEPNVIEMLQNAWSKNPTKNQHIVMNFDKDYGAWISFLDDSQVLDTINYNKKVPREIITN